jgi:hypothetical protein
MTYVAFRVDKPKKETKRLIRYTASYQFLTDQIDEKGYRKVMERGE